MFQECFGAKFQYTPPSTAAWRAPVTVGTLPVSPRSLARASQAAAVRDTRWERTDLRALERSDAPTAERFDLVVLGHVLNELDAGTQRRVVAEAAREVAGYERP